TVNFDVVTEQDCVAPVLLADSAAVREVAVNFTPVGFATQNGHILVMSSEPVPPLLSGAGFNAGEFSITVPTSVGRRYILEFTDSLSGSWQSLPAVQGDGTVKLLSDPSPNSQQRFYRVRVE